MNTHRQSPFANIPPVVKNLIIINVIFFIATVLFEHGDSSPLVEWLAIFYPASPHFRIWQIITYMFMHANIGHILFNMFALFIFGPPLEYIMGPKRFLNFYLLTGFGALVLQFMIQGIEVYQIIGSLRIPEQVSGISNAQYLTLSDIYNGPLLGASGAIFGVMIGFGMLFPNVEMMLLFFPIPIKAKYLIPLYIVFELYSGVRNAKGDSVAHFAHLGGALFGFILIKLWGYKRRGD